MKNLLALDVGFSGTGFAIFNSSKPINCGVLITERTAKKTVRAADDLSYRSGSLARQLGTLIDEKHIYGIVAEMPSGGAQNADAMAKMNMANAIVSAVAVMARTPMEITTPREVKLATTGFASATKRMMCEAICKRYGGKVIHKTVKTKKGVRVDQRYDLLGSVWPEGLFEHIADACGAYLALQDGVLAGLQNFYRGELNEGKPADSNRCHNA